MPPTASNKWLMRLLMLFFGCMCGLGYHLCKIDVRADYFWSIRLPLVLILGILFSYAFHYVNIRIYRILLGGYDYHIQSEDMKNYLVAGLVLAYPLQKKFFHNIYPSSLFIYFFGTYLLIILLMKFLLIANVKKKATVPRQNVEAIVGGNGWLFLAAVLMMIPLFWFHQFTLSFDDFFRLSKPELKNAFYHQHSNVTRKTFLHGKMEYSATVPFENSEAVVGFRVFKSPEDPFGSEIPIVLQLRVMDDQNKVIAEKRHVLDAAAAESRMWQDFQFPLPGLQRHPVHFVMKATPSITGMGWRYLIDFLMHSPLAVQYFSGTSVQVGWSEPEIVQINQTRPNVILISIDTLRQDALGCYGNDKEASPAIDRFARENTMFENAFSQCSWTLPSYLSMLTSLYPPELKREFEGLWGSNLQLTTGDVRSLFAKTFVETLREHGYYCAGFTGGSFISAFYGFYKGFHFYWEKGTPYDESFLVAEKWMKENREKNFFVFLHSYTIHSVAISDIQDLPSSVPSLAADSSPDVELLRQFVLSGQEMKRTPYQYSVRLVDLLIGRMLSFLKREGLYENTLIIITSDHGTSLGEVHNNGKFVANAHGLPDYEEQIRIPLIIKLPAKISPGPQVIKDDARLVDIGPTILAVLGLDAVPEFRGQPLFADFRTSDDDSFSGVFATGGGSPNACIRINRKKYIVHQATGQEEFYDLAADPGETRNLASPENEDMLRLKRQLIVLLEKFGDNKFLGSPCMLKFKRTTSQSQ